MGDGDGGDDEDEVKQEADVMVHIEQALPSLGKNMVLVNGKMSKEDFEPVERW